MPLNEGQEVGSMIKGAAQLQSLKSSVPNARISSLILVEAPSQSTAQLVGQTIPTLTSAVGGLEVRLTQL